MCNRFIKFIPSEEAFWLLENKPNAFRLLTHIANTARRSNGHPDGLSIGQCHLENWENYKLTEREYRTAKSMLIMRGHIQIISTNRTRQKSTTGTTTRSTLVQLLTNTIWDINPEVTDDSIDDRATTDRRLTDDKQESKESKERKRKEEEYAQTAARLRTKDALSFDFQTWSFLGISDHDQAEWKTLYPHIDIEVETTRAANWLKSNPTKSNKKLWRKYLTGWFGRSNDSIENKKAYRSASGTSVTDRRTRNKDGTISKSRAEDLF